jgi:DNA-binding SARP family transcriptional activator
LPPASDASEGTRIQLCGRLSVEIAGADITDGLRGRQVPLLLTYLVLNRSRPLGRDELSDALWPYHAPRSQDAALRTLLSRLRSALNSGGVVGREELILQLPEPVWVDLEAASIELQRALAALDSGDARSAWALAQVPLNIASRGLLPGAQAAWLELHRRELEDVRLSSLEVIGRAGLRLGGAQLTSVERVARNLIENEPYRESGYALLMEALAARGNVAEALRVYERVRTLLRDELGTSPSPETIAVHERLLRPESTPPSRAGTRDHHAGIELPAELRAHATPPLIGRRRELEQLCERWQSVVAAPDVLDLSARLVFLSGDPGIGKTSLAAALARRAHEGGALVLPGRATAVTLVPYQPFIEALRHYLVGAPLSELRANARDYGGELARLVPELRRRAPDLPEPIVDEPETARYRLFEAVVGLLASISASTPILLVLDDLHWADRPTLLLLRHLVRAADPARLLILGVYRATEVVGAFADALAELRQERLVVGIEIAGLNQHETAELVSARTGAVPPAAFARSLHARTEGNPFFVEEIVRHLLDAGIDLASEGPQELQRFGLPEGVKETLARRLTRLGPQATEWLRVAAVIGRDFDSSLLERVLTLDEDEFLDALDEVLAAGVVTEAAGAPGRYTFAHALIRETLYDGMSAPRRARAHRRVGEALEAAQGRRSRYIPALAHHFTRAAGAEDAEKAITYARRAGEQATAMLAHEEAAEHYARALEVLDRFYPEAVERRCELLLLLGEARVRSGERPLGWEAFREAAALAEQLGDAPSLARAAIGASRRYVQPPGVVDTELIAMLKRALEMMSGERTLMRVCLLARLCGALYYSPQRDLMQALSEEAVEIARELDSPEPRAWGCAAQRRALWAAPHLDERLSTSTEMLTSAREAGNLELELQAHAWLVVDLLEHGERDAVDAQIDAFNVGAQHLRQPLYLWQATIWRAMLALLAGRLEPAEQLAGEALASGGLAEPVTAAQYYAIQLLLIRREQARLGELEDAARQAVEANPAPAWRAALATLLWESGKTTEAREQFELLAAHDFKDIPQDGDWMIAITLLADLSAGLGDAARAALLYQLLSPYASANVMIGFAVMCLGPAARFLGKLSATTGREEEAREHFERALRACAALKAPVWLAHTQLDYAGLLGRGTRRRELIDAAERTAGELDLPWVARRAAELRR